MNLLLNSCEQNEIQPEYKHLASLLKKTDSVFLINHITTEEYAPRVLIGRSTKGSAFEQWKEENPTAQPFLIDNDINKNIIKESKKLSDVEQDELLNILIQKDTQKNKPNITCDVPHNSILIYTKGKLSYFDICFDCQKVHCSDDINISVTYFDESKWKVLENFFHRFVPTRAIEQ